MKLFYKLLTWAGFDTTLGVSVQEIKNYGIFNDKEEPNISVHTTSYSYPDGVKKAHMDIRVVAKVKLTDRSKIKKVLINIPFDQTAMEEIINKLNEETKP